MARQNGSRIVRSAGGARLGMKDERNHSTCPMQKCGDKKFGETYKPANKLKWLI